MEVILTSDLHVGHSENTERILEHLLPKIRKSLKAKVLLIAGDLISHDQDQKIALFKLLRKHWPRRPIGVVYGNHDFWGCPEWEPGEWIDDMLYRDSMIFEDFRINYLPTNPITIDNVKILGFDGWYGHPNPPTNDLLWFPQEYYKGMHSHEYLLKRSEEQLQNLLDTDTDGYGVVTVTHFPLINQTHQDKKYNAPASWLPPLREKSDIIVWGHKHVLYECAHAGCFLVGSGSDYDKPMFYKFFIDECQVRLHGEMECGLSDLSLQS